MKAYSNWVRTTVQYSNFKVLACLKYFPTINKSEFSKGGGSNQLYVFTERKIIIERNAQIANLINSKKRTI